MPLPENVVGPVAVSSKSAGIAVPPLFLVSFLISVNPGPLSSFVMVQVTSSFGPMVTIPVSSSKLVAPVQDHSDAR